MADKMTRADFFFFFLSFLPFWIPKLKINGALFSEVNGIIAQGNKQQMEYAKWNPEKKRDGEGGEKA